MGSSIGKASNSVIKRSVLKLIKKTDKNVLTPAVIGCDCAVVKADTDYVFMASSTGL